jgi:hypothetical protein
MAKIVTDGTVPWHLGAGSGGGSGGSGTRSAVAAALAVSFARAWLAKERPPSPRSRPHRLPMRPSHLRSEDASGLDG